MDLNSMLNPKRPEEDYRESGRRSVSAQSQGKPSLPALSTQPSSGSQGYLSRPSDAYTYTPSPALHTPTPPAPPQNNHHRPSHGQYASAPMTPGQVLSHQHAPLQSPQVLHSPYGRTATTPGSGQPGVPSHYFARQPSMSQTPSSAHEYTPGSQHRSPHSPHHSRPGPPTLQHQQSYPGTPLGPPPSRSSMPPVGESPVNHRKPSYASQAPYPNVMGPYQPGLHRTASYTNSPESRHQRPPLQRQDTSSSSNGFPGRERSVSVSPKTVVTNLPSARSDSVVQESQFPPVNSRPQSFDNSSTNSAGACSPFHIDSVALHEIYPSAPSLTSYASELTYCCRFKSHCSADSPW